MLAADPSADHAAVETATVVSMFSRQVERRPDAIAVKAPERKLTYREIDRNASCIALALQECGVAGGSIVAVSMPRTPEFVTALLGILKAGGAYLPISPAWPEERVAKVLEVADASVAVIEGSPKPALPASTTALAVKEALRETGRPLPEALRMTALSPEDPAYVNFTSGSSGTPKGVLIPHRGVTSLLLGQTYAQFSPDMVTLQHFAPSFDPMTFEIWAPLLHGGTCALYSGTVPTIGRLVSSVVKHSVNTLVLTASLFNMIVDDAPEMLEVLKTLLVGGEALSPSHALKARSIAPKLSIINAYGPTEVTFIATYFPISEMRQNATTVPLGFPLNHRGVHILNQDLQPVTDGEIGEICVSGPGLALGYVRDKLNTDKAFVTADSIDGSPMRIYRTGDMGCVSDEGLIEYHGRTDTQIQLNGYRIELEEIDRAIVTHPSVKQAVTTPCGTGFDLKLCAVVVSNNGIPDDLSDFLARLLPGYMVPRKFAALRELPLNAHGKIDRRQIELIFGNDH